MSSYNKYFNEDGSNTGGGGSQIPANVLPYILNLNQSLSTTSSPTFDKLYLSNGSVSTPAYSWSSQPSLGIYLNGLIPTFNTKMETTDGLGLDDGMRTSPSLYFKNYPTMGLYAETTTMPAFNSRLASDGFIIQASTKPTILGYGMGANAHGTCVLIGHQAGLTLTSAGVQNSMLGAFAGGTLTTGVNNTLLGYNTDTVASTTSQSVGIGSNAKPDTDGVAVGFASKSQNGVSIGRESNGSTNCVSVGYSALRVVENIGNTGIGHNAMKLLTTGIYNTGLGNECMSSLTLGQNNTGCGGNTLGALTTGNYNTALGNSVGGSLQTGDKNTLIGSGALCSTTGCQNAVALGANTEVDTNSIAIGQGVVAPANTTIIGNISTLSCKLLGKVGIGQDPDAIYTFALTGSSIYNGSITLKGSSSGTLLINQRPTYTSYNITMPSSQGVGALTNDGTGVLNWGSPLAISLLAEYNGDTQLNNANLDTSNTPFYKFYATATMTVRRVRLFINSLITVAGNVRVAIYEGLTTNIIGQSGSVPAPLSTVGEMYVAMPDVVISIGVPYYIAIDVSNTNLSNKFLGSTGISNNTQWFITTADYSGGFPATRPTSGTNATQRLCIALLSTAS